MIVISKDLALAPFPGINLNAPLLGWQTVATRTRISATSEAAGFPATNLAIPATSIRWQGDTTDEQSIVVAGIQDEQIDYIGIARHNFASGQIAVAIEIQRSLDEDYELVMAEFIPTDNRPLLARFMPQFAINVRIRMTPTGGVVPNAAVLYVGRSLLLPRNIYVGHVPIPFAKRVRKTSMIAESGDYLGSVVLSETYQNGIEMQNIPPAFMREQILPFIEAAPARPFFFAWRPLTYPREVSYAWAIGDITPDNQRHNGMMQMSIQMKAVAS